MTPSERREYYRQWQKKNPDKVLFHRRKAVEKRKSDPDARRKYLADQRAYYQKRKEQEPEWLSKRAEANRRRKRVRREEKSS